MQNFPLLHWLIIAGTAAIAVYGALALVIEKLRRLALAHPNPRSSHRVPTPQGAGIVLVPVALIAAGAGLALSGTAPPGGLSYAAPVAAMTLALMIVGFLDDTRGLGIVPRLAVQIVAVSIAVVLLPTNLQVLPLVPLWLERIALAAAGLWFVNLVNFMDGIDLISAVETVAIALGVAILAALGVVPAADGWIAVALLGATFGFALWNIPPARVFLGDAGSLPIGLLLGVLLLHVATANAAAAIILPLYYLADATITLLRRLWRREPVWQAHREHFYQRATRNGYSVTETVARIALTNAVLIGLAVAATFSGRLWAALMGIAALAVVAWTLRGFATGR